MMNDWGQEARKRTERHGKAFSGVYLGLNVICVIGSRGGEAVRAGEGGSGASDMQWRVACLGPSTVKCKERVI